MTAEALLRELTRRGVTLWVDDDRVRYRAAREALTDDLLEAMQRHRADLLRLLRDGAPREFPLSYGQQGIWFLCREAPESTAYNIAFACRVVSHLDVPALERAFQALVDRHPSLRGTYTSRDDAPVQRVLARLPLTVERVDASGWSDARLAAAVEDACERPFDLERGPLVRVGLYASGRGHVLLLTMHHLTHDGWSLWLLLDELRELYDAWLTGRPASLPPLAATYEDFVRWQRDALATDEARRARAYWQRRLAGPLPILNLPADRPRPAMRSDRGASLPFVLDAELTRRVRALAQAEGSTLYTLLLAAFQTLLHRYSGQDDVVVGSPIWGRGPAEFANVVGYCINQVAMRGDCHGDPSFSSFLAQIRRRTLEAVEHGDYPFTRLVDELQLERDPGRTPVFQVTFALQRPHRFEDVTDLFVAAEMGLAVEAGRRVTWGALELEPYVLRHCRAWFDLTVQMMEVRDVLAGSFSYSTDLFDEATMRRMVSHFSTLLRSIVAGPASPLSRLALLDGPEEAAAPRAEFPVSRCLHELFEAQAMLRPEAIALTDDTLLTYGGLNARANRLARRLRTLGIGPESIVGVCAERSPELLIAILAVLKAGGAYLPLDPGYPPERLALTLEDAGARVLLAGPGVATRLPASGPPRLLVDDPSIDAERADDLPPLARPDNLAYVIYTSGSTGRPKGVLVTHANVVRLFAATEPWFSPGDGDVWTLFHSAAFDFSVWELWGALLHGGRLVVVSQATSRSPEDFAKVLDEQDVTLLNQTPTAFYPLAQVVVRDRPEAAATLRAVVFGGEALDPPRLRPWVDRFGDRAPRLINMYGITETTVHVTYRPIVAADCERRSSRLGEPIPDLQTWIVDRHLARLPLGVPGEICVGGAGLARGYLGRPALTAERFPPDPFGARAGARLYRSGDLARALPDRDLEYLARADQQVKVRGFRIEPGEIEAALEQHPAVRVSCVVPRAADGESTRLVAYVVPDVTRAAPVTRALQLRKERRLDPAWLHELPNGMTIAHLNRAETAFVYEEIFERRAYLKHGIRVEDGDCVFDVGANIGLFPLSLDGRRLKVYAFEPVPPLFERLRANCRLYDVDAELFECALGREPGQASFTYYPNASVLSGRFADAGQEAALVKTYLLRQQAASGLGDGLDADGQLAELVAERLESRNVVCRVRTLSSVIAEHHVARVDLLKIDVEKSEIDVLAGIAADDWPKIQQIVVEVHDGDGRLAWVEGLLEAHGFRLTIEQDVRLAGTGLYSVYATRRADPAPAADAVAPAATGYASAHRLVSDLRAHARARLPEYMVPAAFVLLDALPMTPNGKVDRRALPAPDAEASAPAPGFVDPRTPAERTLAGIWARVLKLERVGVTDNFFELGGDSILSIAVATRAQDAGLRMVSRQLFQHQTVAELAAALDASPAVLGSAGAVHAGAARHSGLVPLVPVQRWFFEQRLADPHHFNQSLVLDLPPGTRPAAIEGALRDLVRAHDALRMYVAPGDHRALRIAAAVDLDVPLVTIDESRAADRLQGSLDLARPPLLRAAWLASRDGAPDRLLLILHHLVVDAVSWRVIVDDLFGERRRPATTTFAEWAERLRGVARSRAIERDLDYWLAPARRDVPPMPVDRSDAGASGNTEASSATVTVALDPVETDALLHGGLAAAGAQANDVLLTALVEAWRRFTGDARLLVDLEGHGREELFEGVDLSRTIGWFTTIFPVLLTTDGDGLARPSPSDQLHSVKAQLRQVPARGLSYGLLRYLSRDGVADRLRGLPSPEIGFNYLGRLDGTLAGLVGGGSGRRSSPRNRRAHRLDVNAFVGDDGLRVQWTFDRHAHDAVTIERLAEDYRVALRDLSVHAPSPAAVARASADARSATADPPSSGIDAGQLRRLSRLLEGKA